MIGQTISHYKILEKLGQGGMGVVYKAEDTTLKRIVALKFLPEHVSASETDKARFLLEAQAAAALNHPNICTIHGIEAHEGQSFIVMEFVDGQTLREKRSGLGLAKAVDVGVQIAEGLAAAHEKGVVHRDIKPENIMIRKDGLVQIMDFGLAKLNASRASRLTKEGSTVGTAGYMSPEQVQGQETDHRSDIFSLGVLLYELFTGELPFKGVHETALLYEIVNVDPAPMSSIKPEIGPELDRIVQECLQKEPDERYNSVKDLAKELKRFKRESSRERASRVMPVNRSAVSARTAPPPASAPGTRLLWPAVAVAALGAAGVLLYLLLARPAEKPKDVTKYVVSLKAGYHLVTGVGAPDISRDGRAAAWIAADERSAVRMIYVRRADELSERAVPGTEGAGDVCFSPDGEWLAFSAGGKLKKIALKGGTPLEIGSAPATRGTDWGDNNVILYAKATGAPISAVSGDGGEVRDVSVLDSSAGEVSHRWPHMLPGGEAMLYTVKTKFISSFSDAKIVAQRLDGTEKKVIVEGGTHPRYLRNGLLLYAKGASLYTIPFDLKSLSTSGTPELVLDSAGMMNGGFGHTFSAVSDDGTIVYAPGGPLPVGVNELTVYDRTGRVMPFLDSGGNLGPFSISPDRKHVAVQSYAANDDIWIYDVERQLPTRFTFAGGNNWFPLWTPDGGSIVFTRERSGAPNLFIKPADGSGSERLLAISPRRQIARSYTPDGKILVFDEANQNGDSDVWQVPLDGSSPAQPVLNSRFNEAFGSVSPDGRWIAYASDESGTSPEVYVRRFPDGEGKWQVSKGGGSDPAWTKGGKEIVYITPDLMIKSVAVDYASGFRTGAEQTLFQLQKDPIDLEVSPDGEQIAASTFGQQLSIDKLVVVVNWFSELSNQRPAR